MNIDILIQHWMFYFIAAFHLGGFYFSTKILNAKNKLNNFSYVLPVFLGVFALVFITIYQKNNKSYANNISIYNYVLLGVMLIMLVFIIRILPHFL